MANYQNFETVDKFKLDKNSYIRLIQVHDSEQPHFVVGFYKESGTKSVGDEAVVLTECYHFIGQTAEYDAASFFCLKIPGLDNDSPIRCLGDCKSYQPDRTYLLTPEKQLQEDQARDRYTEAREASRSRTAHLRSR